MMIMKGENKETILSGNLNWKTKVFGDWWFIWNRETMTCNENHWTLMKSYMLLLVDLSTGNKDSPLKQGSEYSLNQLTDFAKTVLAFGSSDISFIVLVHIPQNNY